MPSISMLLTMKGRSLHMNTHEGSRSGLFPGLRRHLGLPTRARAGMAGAMVGGALAMSAAPAMGGTNRWAPGGPGEGGGAVGGALGDVGGAGEGGAEPMDAGGTGGAGGRRSGGGGGRSVRVRCGGIGEQQ